jgi:hypothetical protein
MAKKINQLLNKSVKGVKNVHLCWIADVWEYIILMWSESKIDAKERVREVFPAIKL